MSSKTYPDKHTTTSYEPSRIVPSTAEWIERAAKDLLQGVIAAFPTETVYGLAGLVTSEEAIASIFALKGRPSSNPLIVHLASTRHIEDVAALNTPLLRRRVELLYPLIPGPLSLILPAIDGRTSPAVRAGGNTVAIRIPRHPVAQALLKQVGRPLAAPSANRSTRVSPTRASHVLGEFPSAGLLILDGGPCEIGLESTVLDLTTPRPTILRPGFITKEALEEALGEPVSELPEAQAQTSTAGIAKSPGLSTIHYAPQTPLYLRHQWYELGQKPHNMGWISFHPSEPVPQMAKETRVLSKRGDLDEAAAQLYEVLRELDECRLDAIIVGDIPEHGVGVAIFDRLRRASRR